MMTKKLKIIWAVDPFTPGLRSQKSAMAAIDAIGSNIEIEVMPTFIMSAGVTTAVYASMADNIQALRRRAEHNLKGIAGKSFEKLKSLRIILKNLVSQRAAAREILQFSKANKADLIVLSSHNHGLTERLVFGSFAETLATLSDLPMLVVPPSWKAVKSCKSILFATDFSRESKMAFEQLVPLAAKQGWKITLFHQVDFQAYALYAFAFAAARDYDEDLKAVAETRKHEAAKWIRLAAKSGVSAEFKINTKQILNAPDSIAREASKGYLFVALASQSGPLKNAFMSGTIRQLIRKGVAPVWVVHPVQPAKSIRGRRARDSSQFAIQNTAHPVLL